MMIYDIIYLKPYLNAALVRLIFEPFVIVVRYRVNIRFGQQKRIGLDLAHFFPFTLIPALNEMTGKVASALAEHYKRLVAPRHSSHFGAVKLIFGKVGHVFKVAFVRVGVVFADPVIALV